VEGAGPLRAREEVDVDAAGAELDVAGAASRIRARLLAAGFSDDARRPLCVGSLVLRDAEEEVERHLAAVVQHYDAAAARER
jgi:hypothetical protein